MTRTIRERPRLAAITAVGLAGLIAVGLVLGLVLAGGGDSGSDTAALREAKRERAALAELEVELDAANARAARFEQAAGTQRARAEGWKRQAERAERRSRELRRALRAARAQSD